MTTPKRTTSPNRVAVYKFSHPEYRRYFDTEEKYEAAMEKADALESKGLKNRAWRVRLNLDSKSE